MNERTLPVILLIFYPFRKASLFPILLLFSLAACSKEEMKPGSDYAGHLIMEYSRSFPELTAQVSIGVDLYTSGNVVLTAPDPVPYTALDSLPGENGIKIGESGTVNVSALSGKWTVKSNTGYVTVNAHVVIEGTRRVWNWDSQAGDWMLSEEITVFVEDPVDYPLDFKLVEAEQTNGSVQGVYPVTEYGSVIYQWTLRLDPV